MLSWPGSSRCTLGMLRRLFQVSSSAWSTTTSTRRTSAIVRSAVSAAFVDGVSPLTNDDTMCTRSLRARSDRAPRSAAAFIFFGVRWS
ncbi:hypothetical protein FrCorBMG51_02935 [Protofrankia coriariae]|uniref:Secreted protein n=1 Tax=Protofrankia coriariae TaxID=1562887 RepID=A0ABR5F7F2_9ACTN|nr:hypothetical protein FrCorBMG51_02935 [Protofrankia coriariae]